MRWEDERYVRVYTRDTPDWLALSWDAQSLLMHLLRKVDRAGLMPLGRHGKRAVAISLGQVALWDGRLAPALEELLADGCVVINGDTLAIRNFTAAQESRQSDAQRKREQRARDRETVLQAPEVTNRDTKSQDVTESHESSQAVTSGHTESPLAVPSCAVPSCATPVGEPAAPGGQESLFPSPTPTPKPKASKATPEGQEFRALSEALSREFQAARREAYPWTTAAGPSNAAVKALQKLRPPDATPESHRAEVVRRWGLALRHPNGFHRLSRLQDFSSRYADYGPQGRATVEATQGARPRDVKRGRHEAADSQAEHGAAPVGATSIL